MGNVDVVWFVGESLLERREDLEGGAYRINLHSEAKNQRQLQVPLNSLTVDDSTILHLSDTAWTNVGMKPCLNLIVDAWALDFT